MKVEDANALRFILQEEIYLLNDDKTLYTAAEAPSPVIETPKPVFNYLGSNKKNFLVLVNYAGHEYIQDDHLAALDSVLGRKGHAREDVAIVNLAKHDWADQQQLLAFFEPKTLVILGNNAIPTGADEVKFNQIEKIEDIAVLYTFSFDEMMTNVEKKKAFWEQIKAL